MTKITTVGLDIAKDVFQVHGADGDGHRVMNRRLRRREVLAFFARLEPCLVGMEACGGAHYWGRELERQGHQVILMPGHYVKPFVKSHKTDANDAEAICEAVVRPGKRTVAIKTVDQQAMLSLHRVRQGYVRERTATANRIRGLLAEFGVVIARGLSRLRQQLDEVLADADNGLPTSVRRLVRGLHDHLRYLDEQVTITTDEIEALHRTDEVSQRLAAIPGVGVLTATALVAAVGDVNHFRNGRQLAAWLGLTPRQFSSGGKARLGRMSKRGDVYLRTLLMHGARAANRTAARRGSPTDAWTLRLRERRPANVVAVARANKMARVAWAMMKRSEPYTDGAPLPVSAT